MQYNIIIVVCMYKWWTVCWEQYLNVKGRKRSLWEIKPTSVYSYTDMYIYFNLNSVASSMFQPPVVTKTKRRLRCLYYNKFTYMYMCVLVLFLLMNHQCMVMSHLKMEEEVLEEMEWCVQRKVKVKVKLSQQFIKYNPMKTCGRENL